MVLSVPAFFGFYLGEQILEIFGIYVESFIMGHGGCCCHGYSIGKWRGNITLSLFIYIYILYSLMSLLIYIYINIELMQGKPPDWQDFVGIVSLLVINSTISFIEENNAGNAAAALMAGLAPKTKVNLH